jgi:hypothetical protein
MSHLVRLFHLFEATQQAGNDLALIFIDRLVAQPLIAKPKTHYHSGFDRNGLFSKVKMPEVLELCSSCWLVGLHYLSSLSSHRVVCKSLPFKAAFGISVFDIRICLKFSSSFFFKMKYLYSDVGALYPSPYEIYHLQQSFRYVP